MMLDGVAGRADGLGPISIDLLHPRHVVVAPHLDLDGDQSGYYERGGDGQGDDDAGDDTRTAAEHRSETAPDGGGENQCHHAGNRRAHGGDPIGDYPDGQDPRNYEEHQPLHPCNLPSLRREALGPKGSFRVLGAKLTLPLW